MRGIQLWGAVVLAILVGAPAFAGPRVTVRSENASLHQILRSLYDATGLQFRSQDGAGEEGYKEPAGARRIKVDWKEAPLGLVVREVCAAFDLTPLSLGDGGYWFRPGVLPKRTEVTADGVAFSVSHISQSESLSFTPGQEKPATQRSLSLRVNCRAEGGDGDIIGPLTRLTLTDENGKAQEARLSTSSYEGSYGLPDERVRSIYLQWAGEHAKRLQRIEGEVALYERAEERRFVLPFPAKEPVPDQQQGPIRLKVAKLNVVDRRTEARFRLEWPADTDVPLYGASSVRVLLRLEGGKTQRVYGGIGSGTEDGVKYAQFDYNVQFDATPTAMEVLVPVRTGNGRKVAFRIENVVMPFGRPPKVRLEPLNMKPRPPATGSRTRPSDVPEAYYDAAGGSLRLPPVPHQTQDESLQIQVGLSRQNTNGSWTANRWVQLEASAEALRLEKLAPGKYRVRLTYWKRQQDGTLKRLPMPEKVSVVEIRKGAEARL
jgi:hypothetical protein